MDSPQINRHLRDVSLPLGRRKLPSQERARKTYEEILAAATLLLEQGGWDGFNTNAVAKAADCRVATVYRYFEDKNDLARVIAERAISEWDDQLSNFGDLVAEAGDFLTAWREHGDRFLELLAQSPQWLAARRAMQAVPELHVLDQEDNHRLAQGIAAAMRTVSNLSEGKATAIARTLIESAVAIVDLATDESTSKKDRELLISTLREMHEAYLLGLGLGPQSKETDVVGRVAND